MFGCCCSPKIIITSQSLSRQLMNMTAIIKRSSRLLSSTNITTTTTPLLTNSTLSICSDSGICTITLNDPAKRNALSSAMMESLLQHLKMAKSDPCTKVLVIQAANTSTLPTSRQRVFCSGHDLTEMMRRQEEEEKEEEEDITAFQLRMTKLFAMCTRFMMEIVNFPVPTVCAVDGIATAAGCQLVASCDLCIATHTSRFATPGVHLGLFCSTPAVALVHSSGMLHKHVMEMLLLGDSISARRAYEIGLVNFIVNNDNNDNDIMNDDSLSNCDDDNTTTTTTSNHDDDLFHNAVHRLAYKIASKPSKCMQLGLQTLRKHQHHQQSSNNKNNNNNNNNTLLDLNAAYQLAQETMVQNLVGGNDSDAVQGIQDFLNKNRRRPSSSSWK